MTYNILTPQEFRDQGTSAANVMSMSKAIRKAGNPALANAVRDVAFTLASMTGEKFHHRAPRQAGNDNRRYVRRAA